MKNKMLSIIVPVYNVEDYIRKCLDSLINQACDYEYEVIIVDDGSTDNSLKICKEYEKNKIIKIFTKKNGGLSSARNYGIDKANGKFIAFVDSDDWVTSNYVQKICEKINENDEYDLITYDVIYINDGWNDGSIREIYPNFDSMDKHDFIRECFNPSFAWARIYKKELITENKFPKENYWYEDMATLPIILSKINLMGYINEGLYYYRQRNSSITSSKMNDKTLGVIKAWNNCLNNIDKEYIEDYVFALYKSLVTFIYFKPEYSDKFMEYYNKNEKYFMNNKLIDSAIEKDGFEDISLKKYIPKKIHYCWFGNGKKGELFERCLESWKKFAPDFEIIEWNETNCDINECKYVKEAYENKKWAFVSDYFRIKVLKEQGGIYVDTDIEFKDYIHSLLLNESFFAFETSDVNAAIFGTIPNSDIINKIYDSYISDKFVLEDGSLNMHYPIPKRISDILKDNSSIKFDGTEQLLENDIKIYSADVLTLNVYNDKNIAEHHYEATWWDAKFGIRSYKYNVLQYYFKNVDQSQSNLGVKYHLRCIFRLLIPLSVRDKMKKIIKRR